MEVSADSAQIDSLLASQVAVVKRKADARLFALKTIPFAAVARADRILRTEYENLRTVSLRHVGFVATEEAWIGAAGGADPQKNVAAASPKDRPVRGLLMM